MLLVLLEVRVDKKATGGINKRVLDVVNTLIPARGQRGGSCGYLVGPKETEMKADIVTPPQKKLPLTSFSAWVFETPHWVTLCGAEQFLLNI